MKAWTWMAAALVAASANSAALACTVPYFDASTPQEMADRHARAVLAEFPTIAEGIVLKEAARLYSGRRPEEGSVRITKVIKGNVRVGDIIPIATNMCADGVPKGARGVVTLTRGARTAWASFQSPVVVQSIERQLREDPSAAYSEPWRTIATEQDEVRINHFMQTWVHLLGQRSAVRTAQAETRARIERLGIVARPDAAQSPPHPAPGRYRCRRLKVGLGMVEQSGFFGCDLSLAAGGVLTLTQLSGPERPMGRLYPRNERQLVFLGTSAIGQETSWPQYGHNLERDLAGIFERIGSGHYRLVMPGPPGQPHLDILELMRLPPARGSR